MNALDLMATRPPVITSQEPVCRAAQLMRDLQLGSILVVDDRVKMNVRGVITDRDIAVRCVAEHQSWACKVEDFMTRGLRDAVTPEVAAQEVVEQVVHGRVSGPSPAGSSPRVHPTPFL